MGRTTLTMFVLFLGLTSSMEADARPPSTIEPSQAIEHVGERKTVCGRVASAMYARRSRGKPTFLNLDRPYPRQVFTAVIWIDARKRFSFKPEVRFKDKRVCVSGRITSYRGKAQIVVKDGRQIRLDEP